MSPRPGLHTGSRSTSSGGILPVWSALMQPDLDCLFIHTPKADNHYLPLGDFFNITYMPMGWSLWPTSCARTAGASRRLMPAWSGSKTPRPPSR